MRTASGGDSVVTLVQ